MTTFVNVLLLLVAFIAGGGCGIAFCILAIYLRPPAPPSNAEEVLRQRLVEARLMRALNIRGDEPSRRALARLQEAQA